MYLFYGLCVFAFWCISGSNHIDDQKPEIIDDRIETIKQRTDLSEKEKTIRCCVSNLYNLEQDHIEAIDFIDDVGGILTNQDDTEISPTIRWLMKEDLDPNIQKHGNTLLHYLTRMTWYNNNPILDCIAEMKQLFIYGANPYMENDDHESPFDLAPPEIREKIYGQWGKVERKDIEQGASSWNRLVPGSCGLPTFVRNHYRYGEKLETDNDNNRILFLIVHGTGMFEGQGRNNTNYYDENTNAFRGLMNFAKMYADEKNKRRVNKNKKAKILHLMSFMWNGHLFDFNRKSSAKELVKILRNWHFRGAHVVIVGHSHGNTLIDFALNELNTHHQKLLLYKNQKRINENKKPLRKGFAQLLFFLAPPCKQVFRNSKKSILFGDHLYGWVNDYAATEPIGYDQLILGYSDEDLIAKLGSVDARTIALMSATIAPMTYLLFKYRNEIGNTGAYSIKTAGEKVGLCLAPSNAVDNNTKLTAAALLLSWVYTAAIGKRAVSRKFKYAHKYTDIMPINESKGNTFTIKGPKAHAQIMLNGEKIGHSCVELLENLGHIWRKLTIEYPGHLACSSEFIVNINTKISKDPQEHIQCFLPEIKKKGHPYAFRGTEKDNRAPDSNVENIYCDRIVAIINVKRLEKNQNPLDNYKLLYLEDGSSKDNVLKPHIINYATFKKLYNKEIPVRILKK